ncbi:hypothetical protein ACKWTF_010312 [Chironomus riparius]
MCLINDFVRRKIPACAKQIAELLQGYSMQKDEADFCAGNFLKAFRKCPDNPSMSLDQWRSELWKNALPTKYQHLAYEVYEQWLSFRYHFLQLPSELVQMLRQLRKNYLLAIISNGPSNAQWEKIHKLGLNMGKNSLFDFILISGDCEWEKPDARIFNAACNYLGVAPQNCIMIGDKLDTDIKGAIEAGLFASVWIPLNFPAPVEQKDNSVVADITISNIYELNSLLIVDDQPTTSSMQGQSTSGNMRSLKLKASRANGSSNGPLTSSSMSSSAMHLSSGCFSTSKNKAAYPYSKRFLSPPDLENDASNASDGS